MNDIAPPHHVTADPDFRLVAAAIRYVTDCGDRPPTVGEIAAAVHVSPSHLRRLFAHWAGVGPKAFAQQVTATRARDLLTRRTSTLDAATALGLSSTGRLHDLLVAVDGMTPGQLARLGEGLDVAVGVHATRLGTAVVGVTERGVCVLHLHDGPVELDRAFAAVAADWPAASLRADTAATRAVASRLDAAVVDDGPRPRFVLRGTNLQLKVWQALLAIPAGQVATYGQLAAAIARPGAVRAVANAVGRNPVAVLIPCHRVIRASGALAGYRWGAERKRALLALEGTAA